MAANAKLTNDWDHTAMVVSLMVNQHRALISTISQKDLTGQPKTFSECHPYRDETADIPKSQADEPIKLPLSALKEFFQK